MLSPHRLEEDWAIHLAALESMSHHLEEEAVQVLVARAVESTPHLLEVVDMAGADTKVAALDSIETETTRDLHRLTTVGADQSPFDGSSRL